MLAFLVKLAQQNYPYGTGTLVLIQLFAEAAAKLSLVTKTDFCLKHLLTQLPNYW